MTQDVISAKRPVWLSGPIAEHGDCTTDGGRIGVPQDGHDVVSIKNGFPQVYSNERGAGGKSVSRKDVNAIFNQISSLQHYYQYMGRNPYNEDVAPYPKGAKVWYSGAEYISTTDNNSTTPDDPSWVKIEDLSGNVARTLGNASGPSVSATGDVDKILNAIEQVRTNLYATQLNEFVYDGENAVAGRTKTASALDYDALVSTGTTVWFADDTKFVTKAPWTAIGAGTKIGSSTSILYPIVNTTWSAIPRSVSISDADYSSGLLISNGCFAKVVCSIQARRSSTQSFLSMTVYRDDGQSSHSVSMTSSQLDADFTTFALTIITKPNDRIMFSIYTYTISGSSGSIVRTTEQEYPYANTFQNLNIDIYEQV